MGGVLDFHTRRYLALGFNRYAIDIDMNLRLESHNTTPQ